MGIHPDQRPRISTPEDEHSQRPTVPTEPWEEDEIEDTDMVVPDEEFENAGIELNNVGCHQGNRQMKADIMSILMTMNGVSFGSYGKKINTTHTIRTQNTPLQKLL